MKVTFALLMIPLMLIAVCTASAQDDPPKIILNPFAKKTWMFDIDRIAKYQHITEEHDDVELGEQTDASLNLLAVYFIATGFGLGLDLHSDWSCDGNYLERSMSVGPRLMYGTQLGPKAHIYGRVGYHFGYEKSIQVVSGNDNNIENKWDLSKISAGVGVPINLNTGTAFFTPEFNWRRTQLKFDDGEEIENRFGLSLSLQTYIGDGQFACDKKLDKAATLTRYDQGSRFIDFSTMGGFRFGSTETKLDLFPNNTAKTDFSGGNLKFKYGHYVADYFAITGGVGFRTNSEKPESSNNEFSSSSWNVSLGAQYNLPLFNRNLFVDLDGQYGNQKTEIQIGTSTNTSKFSDLGVGLRLGYNAFFAKDVAVTPIIGYELSTVENTDTDVEVNRKGFNGGLGVRFIF